MTKTSSKDKNISPALLDFLTYHNSTLEELLLLDDRVIFEMVGCTVQLLIEIRSLR